MPWSKIRLRKEERSSLPEKTSGPGRGMRLMPEPDPSKEDKSMPELTPQSTSTSPPDPVFENPLPLHDPEVWEAFPAFRETFLMHVTPLGYSTALRVLGQMLYGLVLEPPTGWPEWEASATRTELSAAVADLRHLQGFLTSVGQEHEAASLGPIDERLSRFAERQAREVARLAERIEKELGEGEEKAEGA
jgi:hypothetical protein